MRDLKDLLEPLARREMPDRWDEVRRRPISPMPEPRRSRAGAYVAAAAVAALAVAVIVRLSPLDGEHAVPREPTPAPEWLVRDAYELAYANEDLTPDGAWWGTTDADTITPSPGASTGTPHYIVVLHGDFVANGVPRPPGTDAPAGHWLYQSYDPGTRDRLDFGLGNQATDVSSMQAFALPPPTQVYRSDAGWAAAIPPGWYATAVDQKDAASHQVVIANADPSSFVYSPDPVPNPTTVGFPRNGVAMLVSEGAGTFPGAPAVSAPVSLADDASRSSGADGSTLRTVLVQGPDAVFSIAVRTGTDAPSLDLRAIERVVASLAFGDAAQPPTAVDTPAPTAQPAVLPTADSVVDGRFVEPVALDDGMLRVDPVSADTPIPDGAGSAADLLWASDLLAGQQNAVIGYGVITLEGGEDRGPAVDHVPGWIVFGWGGISYCPNIPSGQDVTAANLPSNGYVAVAVLPDDGMSDFSYRARTSSCGEPPHGPSIGMATHVESIAWTQDGPATDQGVKITYTPAPCGSHATFVGGSDGSRTTLTVTMSVPDAAVPCPSPSPHTDTLTGPGWGTGTLGHGDLGTLRQFPAS